MDRDGFIASVVLVVVFAAGLRAVRDSFWRVALLSLPGTIAHELAHLVVGYALGARPQRFSLWPRREGNRWILGFVTFGNLNVLNAAPVALAPLALLPLALLCFRHVLVPLWESRELVWWVAGGYLTAAVFLASLPSVGDWKIGARSTVLYAAIAVVAWLGSGYFR